MIRAETHIARVTLHPNGALVVRAGVAPGAGRRSVEVAGLPLLFSSDALRVRPTGTGTVTEVSEACRVERTGEGDEALALDGEARRLAERRAALDVRIQVLEAREQALRRLAPGARPEDVPLRFPDAGRWAALGDVASDRSAALDQAWAAVAADRDALDRDRAELERRRSDVAPVRYVRGVRFELDGCDAFEIEYFVQAARWRPGYVLEVDGDRASLSLEAFVAQASGEDWRGAVLSFSTTNLARTTEMPTLSSWRIGRRQPAPRRAFRPLPDDLGRLFGAYDASASRLLDEAEPTRVMRARTSGAPPTRPREEPPEAPPPPQMMSAMPAASMAPPPPMPAPARPMAKKRRSAALARSVPEAESPEETVDEFDDDLAPAGAAFGLAADGFGGGGGPRGGAPLTVTSAEAELPPRFRHGFLRMAGPEEPARGRLVRVDPFTHLWSLLGDGHQENADGLRDAIRALERAGRRLADATPPPGTRPIDPDSFPAVHVAQGPHDVLGDGRYHRLPVRALGAEVRTRFRVVPRESEDVHRFVLVRPLERERGAAALPAGPLDAWFDGAFQGSTELDAAGGGPIALDLGPEPAIRVMERTARVQQQEKGLMSQTSRVDHEVTLRIRSGLQVPIEVDVYDRIPAPAEGEKDLQVELLQSTPEPAGADRGPDDTPVEGARRWVLSVPAGGRAALEYAYRLSLPAKSEIVGGNRRE